MDGSKRCKNMNLLDVKALCKTYGSGETAVHALKNASFSAPKGEFVAIVGESGSGKSTLLNLLGGLDVLNLKQRRNHLPSQLSGGQQQRVAIGRALMTRPALILADEPTGNLDSQNSAEVIALLREASRTYEQTIVMITHNRAIAQSADRVLQVSDGTLTDFGRCRA